ncbi:MAG TPA: 16S rRNA processing protein RimM [Rhodobiaceae bacterium]|nr:16S rRNA processing protein RimM [Rhodobiaceae bacterium]
MRICVGAVAGAHGVKGDVRIKTFTENPMDIAAYGALSDEAGQNTFEILNTYPDKMGARVRFRNVTSRSQAEALKGTRLYVERDHLPELDEEDFYHADLIGLTAVTVQGEKLGMVKAVHNFGSADLLEIEGQFIPFTKINVPEIDFKLGTLTIIPPQDFEDEASE